MDLVFVLAAESVLKYVHAQFLKHLTWSSTSPERLVGPKTAHGGRFDKTAALHLHTGNSTEHRARAADRHNTQEARHGAHTHLTLPLQEELNRTDSCPPEEKCWRCFNKSENEVIK